MLPNYIVLPAIEWILVYIPKKGGIMKLIRIFFVLFFTSLLFHNSVNAQNLPKKFQQLLNETHMRYSIPHGFTTTAIIENGDVAYDFAVKSKTKKLEIRYRIWPTKDNSMTNPMLITMALNISNGEAIEPQSYPPSSVKEEFGADNGSTVMVFTNSEFGKGYKACLIFVIHKNNIGDAYVFFLFDDPQILSEAIFTDEIYHALKFK